ncbi:unnamed protein product [Tenebrio molitor]|nr:unnamed protein product [Tenebrio molitor]
MPFWQNQPQQPPPYSPNYPPPQQNYYYNDPSYNQRGTPAYQQRVGGQNVYTTGGPGYEPPNVSRGQPAYRANDPQEAQQSQFWRNSEIFTDAFNTTAIRNRFVQRVYIILALQLFITFGFIIFATFHIDTKLFFAENKLVISIVSMVMYLILYLALACCVDLRRNFPVNFIMLGLLTVALTLLMTTLTAFSSPVVVLAAIGTTAIVCTLVSIFACQTKFVILVGRNRMRHVPLHSDDRNDDLRTDHDDLVSDRHPLTHPACYIFGFVNVIILLLADV